MSHGGSIRVLKVPTSRPSPAPGVLAGLSRLAPPAPFEVAHGTTTGTNAFLERKGSRTALVTTRGFRDLLLLGRGTRPELYALEPRRPEPLVPRGLCFELDERVAADGSVLRPLQEPEVENLAEQLVSLEVEAVGVCLLFSYRNAAHEQKVGEILARKGLEVSLSSVVSPEYREYERASTTVLNAYLQTIMARYLARLEESLEGSRLWVVHSAGAVMTAAEAAERSCAVVLSGPAAGVRGAFHVASEAGFTQLITLDMGGTSTDVSLCPGEIAYVSSGELDGLPVRQPMIDVVTVGAGGGSIARLDEAGSLCVGPESAGSDPGPAAYGKGSKATVTDAHVVLGRLPSALAGGEVTLDVERARRAVQELAGAMNCSLEEAARGILAVASAHMERALRVISVERGHDPRNFTLLPFGGAGPLHAAELAEKLGIPRVLVPPTPGVLSALGAVVAPWMREFSRTVLKPLESLSRADYAELESLAPAEGVRLERLADLRYQGQGFELTVPVPRRGSLRRAFDRAHKRRFGYCRPDFPVEVVTLRLRAVRTRAPSTPAPALPEVTRAEGSVLDRARLGLDFEGRGPLIITQYDTTTLVPEGWRVRVDGRGNLLLENGA